MNKQIMDIAFKKGQEVRQEFGGPVMKVIGFEPELIENVITQWEDDNGTIITAKFMDSLLIPADH
ncbi:hypothetical protein SOM12_12370 [Flavobacterium sp. CFBP9031]|jgi:hypothetical protein|uniref:hypothetical protein n=1 Tax=Flavobacterium sp. CFBP9031 TaxID=3096538 RepID=UPI002A6B7F2A|nr:hypothetical protein [Flavobacterium sp. CFBP9031]MDY0988212.1 hypothetical protein [Flavobacterium sp. CFBP9031]